MTAEAAAANADAAAFDPMAGVFVAQRSRPPELRAVDLRQLSPFQRGLLATDGTVTQFIEAYTLEPVEVVRLAQVEAPLAAAEPWLDLPAGALVIRRRVVLWGGPSRRFHVWADSVIATERLAPPVRRALDHDGGGLGRILVEAGAETRRECLWYGRERRGDVPGEVAAAWNGEFLTRAYRVLADARPMMMITEHFPL